MQIFVGHKSIFLIGNSVPDVYKCCIGLCKQIWIHYTLTHNFTAAVSDTALYTLSLLRLFNEENTVSKVSSM